MHDVVDPMTRLEENDRVRSAHHPVGRVGVDHMRAFSRRIAGVGLSFMLAAGFVTTGSHPAAAVPAAANAVEGDFGVDGVAPSSAAGGLIDVGGFLRVIAPPADPVIPVPLGTERFVSVDVLGLEQALSDAESAGAVVKVPGLVGVDLTVETQS